MSACYGQRWDISRLARRNDRRSLELRMTSPDAAARIALNRVLEERAPEIADDPRVRPTIRIAGIGHRTVNARVEAEIKKTIGRLLRHLRAIAESALRQPAAVSTFRGGLDIFVITPLAEGADRLIANAALDNHCRLGAIIPFNISNYESTFDLSEDPTETIHEFRSLLSQAALPSGYGVLVLDGPSSDEKSRKQSYRDCSRAVARWSDMLIAILSSERWGSETGLGVRDVIGRGVPAIVIDPKSPGSFSLSIDGRTLANEADTGPALELFVTQLLGATGPFSAGGERSSVQALDEYRNENIACEVSRRCDFEHNGPFVTQLPTPWWIAWFSGCNRFIAAKLDQTLRRNRAVSTLTDHPPRHVWDLPFDVATASPVVELFLHHHRADVAAKSLAELHRSAQILIALLGLLISAFAIADFVFHPNNLYATLVELSCLLYALLIVGVAHRQRWLARWIDYRLIAEILRYARYLLICGRPVSFSGLDNDADPAQVEHNWTYEHCRRVLRSLRMAMPSEDFHTAPVPLSSMTRYLVDQCVNGQIVYHQQSAHLRSAASRLLRDLTMAIIAMAVIAVTFKLFLHSATCKPATILLPTVAGALLAMRGYGEHSLVARRSSVLMSTLLRCRDRIERSRTINELGEQMAVVAQVLLRDVDGWSELFADKHIEL